MSPLTLTVASFAAMLAVTGLFYLAYVKIETPESPRRRARHFAADDDRETEQWFKDLLGPARVMADPLRVRLAMYTQLAAAQPRHARPQVVSGPAPASPGAESATPPAAAAGPETPLLNPAQLLSAEFGPGHTGPVTDWEALPPVEQAAHLQPIEWADSTGSFAAICEEGQ